MNFPAFAVFGELFPSQLQLIPPGNSPLPLRVIYLSATGLPVFGTVSPTVFVCELPLIGYTCASGLVTNREPRAAYTYPAVAFVARPAFVVTAITPALLA